MKSALLCVVMAFAMLASACYNHGVEEEGVFPGVTVLTLETADSRTSLGEKDGDTYPVYWSEGDRIALNGKRSEVAEINPDNPKVANFIINYTFSYPYRITYPYVAGTSSYSSRVVFPAEQSYVEGSFASESAPMCAYVASENDSIELKHLAGVLCLPVKAHKEGIVLQKVVIKSMDRKPLSGTFTVDCQSATISPTIMASTSITYTLPANFTLSTTVEKPLYITLPAGEAGPCVVEFVDSKGGIMVGTWESKNIAAGVVREFRSITYKAGVTCALPPMGSYDDLVEIPYKVAKGYVRDSSGNGIKGVAVSNGFTVVETDAEGYYAMLCSNDVWYIYISIPSEYEVPINNYGQPAFFQRYTDNQGTYNFELKPLAGGKEQKFSLVVLTDLHVSTSFRRARFREEAVPSIVKNMGAVQSSGLPCYGLTLGDLISNSSSTDTSEERVNVRSLLSRASVGFPVFQVMGNHDNTFSSASKPVYADATSSTFNLKMQRAHEDIFGPANFSFNRGDVHIIGMRNIIYTSNAGNSSYEVGFTDEQWEWLKQDLALVPKDKMVVLGCHIKLNGETKNHIPEVTALLGEYKEAHVFTGHSHVQRHYPTSGSTKKVFEHNLAAIAGASWYCKMCEDGCPIGYNVYVGDGATFSDWYFMAFNKGVDSRAQQMRLYRGNAVTGAKAPSAPGTTDNASGVKGFYQFNFADNVILANVYNAESGWVVKVYEDGVYSGDMTKLPATSLSFSTLIGDGSAENPFRFEASVSSGHDLYTAGLLIGIQSRYSNGAPAANCWQGNAHMYKYELKNKDAQIKVVAIDRFGNEYSETKITEGTDYTLTSGDYRTDDQIKL